MVRSKSDGKKPPVSNASSLALALPGVGLGMTKAFGKNNEEIRIDPITFNKYAVGSLTLGCILQLSDSYAVVSLPGGQTGTIQLQEVSDVAYRLVTQAGQDQRTSLPSGKKKKAKVRNV